MQLSENTMCAKCADLDERIERSRRLLAGATDSITLDRLTGLLQSYREERDALHPPSGIEPLILCPSCRSEMRLFGIESHSSTHDLLTFECASCGDVEARSVLVSPPMFSFEISD